MSRTVAQVLSAAAAELDGISDTPRLDAEILLAHALEIGRASLLARLNEAVDPPDSFRELLHRRAKAEPLAYLFGEWEFFSRPFFVEAPALVPRPETEHLVEAVLEHASSPGATILELGTGTGCVAVTLACELPNARVSATDINPAFLALAGRNAKRHGVAHRVSFRESDWFSALEGERFDVICSNPPYVEDAAWDSSLPLTITGYEDPAALLAGPEGLDCIRAIANGAPAHLNPGGHLALEIGMGQYPAVENILRSAGFVAIESKRDLAGIERIAIATWKP